MSRGKTKPPDPLFSGWASHKLSELRRQLQESGEWPETGNQLLTDLMQMTSSNLLTSLVGDDDMLSIVVSDALTGIDVAKKYPAFYSQMLVDEELREAFLDTLELLEQSKAGELSEYLGPKTVNLEFLKEIRHKPIVEKSAKEKWLITWRRTIEQLQNNFFIATLQPGEVYRSGDIFMEERYINLLQDQVEIEKQLFEIRLDALQSINAPDYLDLMMVIFSAQEVGHQEMGEQESDQRPVTSRFKAEISWGDYRQTAGINEYGLAKFPPLEVNRIFAPTGKLLHSLEFRLEEREAANS
jgi:hypothetical protein